MSVRGKRLHLLTPMYGGVLYSNYHESKINLIMACQKYGVQLSFTNIYNESLISRGRNRLADVFLKTSGDDVALFIDADIGFDAMDVLAMLELDRDIVGAGCAKKTFRWDRVQRVLKGSNGREFSPAELASLAGDLVINWDELEEKNEELELSLPKAVKHLGTGMLMIKREVFNAFREKYPERWYEPKSHGAEGLPGPVHDFFRVGVDPESHVYWSEDYWFCSDCKAIGFNIYLCPWVRTSHMGTYKFIGDLPAIAALAGSQI